MCEVPLLHDTWLRGNQYCDLVCLHVLKTGSAGKVEAVPRGKPALEAGNTNYSCACVGAEEADDSEDEEAAAKTKKETQWSWELLNDNKALWLRSAKDVDEEEYDKFFQTLSKVCEDLLQ